MSYSSGHPWYYVLDGKPLFPSQIKARINLKTYPDLMVEDILKASKMAEPKRSERLRAIRLKIRASLSADLNRYRECVQELKNLRRDKMLGEELKCEDIHQSISLKHNHIYNDYAQLMICESHLAKQAELFAFG